jgi:hypothetical protein
LIGPEIAESGVFTNTLQSMKFEAIPELISREVFVQAIVLLAQLV